jgi:hypothetical protein
MQIVWNRIDNRVEVPDRVQRAESLNPGGLAGWVLGLIRGSETRKTAKHLRVVEHLALGGRRQLTLVVCDGERFLVGGSADGVETIVRVGTQSVEASCL